MSGLLSIPIIIGDSCKLFYINYIKSYIGGSVKTRKIPLFRSMEIAKLDGTERDWMLCTNLTLWTISSPRWNPSTDKTIIYSWIRNGKQLWQHRTILSVEPRRQIFVTVVGKSASETTLRHQPWIVRCCPICCGALCCQTVDDSILTANCWRIMHRYEEWRSSNE